MTWLIQSTPVPEWEQEQAMLVTSPWLTGLKRLAQCCVVWGLFVVKAKRRLQQPLQRLQVLGRDRDPTVCQQLAGPGPRPGWRLAAVVGAGAVLSAWRGVREEGCAGPRSTAYCLLACTLGASLGLEASVMALVMAILQASTNEAQSMQAWQSTSKDANT